MPRISTFPTILDEVKQVSITNLKKFGLFEPGTLKSGLLTWSWRGEQRGSINILVDLRESPHTVLSYTYNKEEQVSYRVALDSVASNLGKGRIWYFVCPHTGKRCRKLYGAGKYFLHRDAYPHAMYESQTYSKYARELDRYFSLYYSMDDLLSELHSKGFTTHYNGKPTKRYKEILSKLKQIRNMEPPVMKYLSQ